jgi:N6-L-threonylcarbamoyladenine synthase
MLILGIESSCDDTAAAVVEDGVKILSNVISSQNEFHQKYGGIVPEIASRKHVELILYVIDEALKKAGVTLEDPEAIAVTYKPGLVGSLLVGLSAAKAIAYARRKPLIGVNHIEAHAYANFMEHPDLEVPHLDLTVSGGHTLLVYIKSPTEHEILGGTVDDAVGEAYDKIAKFLNLGFPGGPIIDRLAKGGDPKAIDFPRPLLNSGDYNFSFSGLKTAVTYFVREAKAQGKEVREEDLLASFQQAAVDVLVAKLLKASEEKQVSTVTLSGGVAANSLLRKTLSEKGRELGLKVVYPSLALCTDNAAIIAGLGYHLFKKGVQSGLDLSAKANLEF